MRATVERITPTKAKEYLKLNDNMRRPNSRKIAQMSRDMKAREWEANGHSIKFYSNGSGDVLKDGQNRLQAVVDSGMAQEFVVVRDIVGDTYVDLGEKRTLPQYLKHEGVPYNTVVASVVANVLSYEHFSANPDRTGWGEQRVSHSDRIHCYQKHNKKIMRWVADLQNTKNLLWRATLSVPMLFGSCPGDYKAAKTDFLYYLSTGEDLAGNDALHALRELQFDARRRKIRYTQRARLALVVKAWNYHRSQMLMDTNKLRFVETGPTAENFPKAR